MVNNNFLEWQQLCDYIKVVVMKYEPEQQLDNSMLASVQKVLTTFRMEKKGYGCKDFLHLLQSTECQNKIDFYRKTWHFESDLHELNTYLKCAKVQFEIILQKEKRKETQENQKIFVIPQCRDDTGLKDLLFMKCDFDERREGIVVASLVQAWCDGMIVIDGAEV